MQEVEAGLAVKGIARREVGDFAAGVVQNLEVGRRLLYLAIGPVAEQRKVDFAARVGEIVDLEISDQFIDAVTVPKSGRERQEGCGRPPEFLP